MKTITDRAGEHPATAHGADRGPAQQENESFRKARLILLPVAVALLIAVFVHLRSRQTAGESGRSRCQRPSRAMSAPTGSVSGIARGHQSSLPRSDS
ncbi:hypothetical protein GCM10018966_053820 [Streptomyces yanii]